MESSWRYLRAVELGKRSETLRTASPVVTFLGWGKRMGSRGGRNKTASLRRKVHFASLEHLKQIKLGKYTKTNLMLIEMNKSMVIFWKIIEITRWQSNFIYLIMFIKCQRGREHYIRSRHEVNKNRRCCAVQHTDLGIKQVLTQ